VSDLVREVLRRSSGRGRHHCLGDGGGNNLVYDHFGSSSEAPSDLHMPLADAVAAMEQFARSGTPVTERVSVQPD
jgi:hypothetical protein